MGLSGFPLAEEVLCETSLPPSFTPGNPFLPWVGEPIGRPQQQQEGSTKKGGIYGFSIKNTLWQLKTWCLGHCQEGAGCGQLPTKTGAASNDFLCLVRDGVTAPPNPSLPSLPLTSGSVVVVLRC